MPVIPKLYHMVQALVCFTAAAWRRKLLFHFSSKTCKSETISNKTCVTVRNSVSFRISFGERLSGACRGQAEAITAELPDSGEMSLGTGVSDVQVRAERVVQGSLAGGCSKLQLLGRGINKRQCGMQRQQLPQRVLHIPPTAGKHLPHETQSDAR